MKTEPEFSEDDLDICWPYHKQYFLQVLNGEYTAESAREDLRSLIGSRFDHRVDTTLCWNCNTVYAMDAEQCAGCGATNANKNPDAASRESEVDA